MRAFLRPASVYHGKQLPNPKLLNERFVEMAETGRTATLEMEPPYRIKFSGEKNPNPPPLGSIQVFKGLDGQLYAVDMRAHQDWMKKNLGVGLMFDTEKYNVQPGP